MKNLDIAREVGAVEFGPELIELTADQLDAFAARIGAEAIAEYQAMTAKGATALADEMRGNEMELRDLNARFEAWWATLPPCLRTENREGAEMGWDAATDAEGERCAALVECNATACSGMTRAILQSQAKAILQGPQ